MEEEKKEVVLNGKPMTEEQFQIERKKLEEKKVIIVEVSKDNYKTRLQD